MSEEYLKNYRDWTRAFAEEKALAHGMNLEEFDWRVIAFARGFYQEHEIMPLTRRIIKFIREHLNSEFDSMALQNRYSDKPLRVIALLAGLPKPIQCI